MTSYATARPASWRKKAYLFSALGLIAVCLQLSMWDLDLPDKNQSFIPASHDAWVIMGIVSVILIAAACIGALRGRIGIPFFTTMLAAAFVVLTVGTWVNVGRWSNTVGVAIWAMMIWIPVWERLKWKAEDEKAAQ